MKSLQRQAHIFEFILGAHMVFSLLVEVQSVLFPVHVLSEMIESLPPYKRPKYPHANHNDVFDYISFFGFCFWLGMKYLFEGLRFNTLIVCAAELFFFLDRALQYADKVMCQVSAILTILYIWTLVSFPVYQFPEPTGPHPVGYRFWRVQDAYHTKVAVFYPAEDPVKLGLTETQIRRMTKKINWAPDNKFIKQIQEVVISRQWISYPEWVLDFLVGHIYKQKMSIMNNAVLMKKEDKTYPVIILSHGLSSHMHSHAVHAKQWASEGYIVMMPQHEELVYPWDDKGTKLYFKDTKPEIMEKFRKIRSAHLLWREEQIKGLIDTIYLKAWFSDVLFSSDMRSSNKKHNLTPIDQWLWVTLLEEQLQFDQDKLIKELKVKILVIEGVISLDPWLFPITDEQLQVKIPETVPSLHIYQEIEPTIDSFWPTAMRKLHFETHSDSKNFYAYKLRGMDHCHLVDLAFIIPAEFEFQNAIRRYDNLQQIYASISLLVSTFLQEFIVEEEVKQCFNFKRNQLRKMLRLCCKVLSICGANPNGGKLVNWYRYEILLKQILKMSQMPLGLQIVKSYPKKEEVELLTKGESMSIIGIDNIKIDFKFDVPSQIGKIELCSQQTVDVTYYFYNTLKNGQPDKFGEQMIRLESRTVIKSLNIQHEIQQLHLNLKSHNRKDQTPYLQLDFVKVYPREKVHQGLKINLNQQVQQKNVIYRLDIDESSTTGNRIMCDAKFSQDPSGRNLKSNPLENINRLKTNNKKNDAELEKALKLSMQDDEQKAIRESKKTFEQEKKRVNTIIDDDYEMVIEIIQPQIQKKSRLEAQRDYMIPEKKQTETKPENRPFFVNLKDMKPLNSYQIDSRFWEEHKIRERSKGIPEHKSLENNIQALYNLK